MSRKLAGLAAAATVYDRIEDVARDTRLSVPEAAHTLLKHGVASVDSAGGVSMSERQSLVAARALDNAELFGL